jgi:hypothetical protein
MVVGNFFKVATVKSWRKHLPTLLSKMNWEKQVLLEKVLPGFCPLVGFCRKPQPQEAKPKAP